MRKTRVFTRRVRDHDRSASQRVANTRMVDVSPRENTRVFTPWGTLGLESASVIFKQIRTSRSTPPRLAYRGCAKTAYHSPALARHTAC